jgi:hypothetical protein
MLGKTEWPPQGLMRMPKAMGSVIQFSGKRYVFAGSRKLPGV